VKIYFIGAGPGDPELITVRGRRLLASADVVVYAGSLVDPAQLEWARPDAAVYDSSSMALNEMVALYEELRDRPGHIARLHTGDPSLFGATQEQIDACLELGMEVEVVPGVSSAFAAAAAIRRELTIPGLSQAVIFARAPGRTPVPQGQSPKDLAAHGATMALYLSAAQLDQLIEDLLPSYGEDCPVRLVHRASWPDQSMLASRLGSLRDELARSGVSFGGQLMVLVGPALEPGRYEHSKLYDAGFTHGYREGSGV
jgi:precorrin-4/cobalt-precorrin-4 C11-methyltransferase